jgi:hypothetical protein
MAPDRARSGLSPVVMGLNAVIVAVTEEVPRILTVKRTGHALAAPEELAPLPRGEHPPDALPFGPLDPVAHRTLDRGVRSWVAQQTGLELGYVEQLYTFGDRFRDPRERGGGPRVLSVAYLALVREQEVAGPGEARWREAYAYLPWEDWREGRPGVIDRTIGPVLERWAAAGGEPGRAPRQERAQIAFGLGGTPWDPDRVLERYELLYEVELVEEAWRDRDGEGGGGSPPEATSGSPLVPVPVTAPGRQPGLGRAMALDHRRILATALGRLRGKIRYRPVVFELLPSTFTLFQLQRAVEALAGTRLHKQNFRRLVERGGLVEGTGRVETSTGGRPAELFRFRREVLRERPAPGVGLPAALRRG